MSILSRLFGKPPASGPEDQAEMYKGFRILPQPESGEGGFRVGARIERDVDGVVKVHHLKRADTLRTRDEAVAFSMRKARQVIDEQGERVFR